MIHHELTARTRAATSLAMKAKGAGAMDRDGTGMRRTRMAGLAILSASLGACINIDAPDKPIVIELNINIRQEVIYRLAEDAANTIEANEDIF